MTAEGASAVATIIQTVAVISGLIFVSVQLRDSRRIAKGAAYQGWLDTILQFFMALAQTEGLSELYWRGRRDIKALDDTEMSQFFYLCVTYFTLLENLYIQFDQGLIPKRVFLSWENSLIADMSSPGFVEYWRLEAGQYNSVFRAFVDRLLLEQVGKGEKNVSAFWPLVYGSSPPP